MSEGEEGKKITLRLKKPEEKKDNASEHLNNPTYNRTSKAKWAKWLCALAFTTMGVDMPLLKVKAALSQVQQVENEKLEFNKKTNAAYEAIKKLENYFEDMKKKRMEPRVFSGSPQAKEFMEKLRPYLEAVGLATEGDPSTQIKKLNEYLGVKTYPSYLTEETTKKLREAMVDLNAAQEYAFIEKIAGKPSEKTTAQVTVPQPTVQKPAEKEYPPTQELMTKLEEIKKEEKPSAAEEVKEEEKVKEVTIVTADAQRIEMVERYIAMLGIISDSKYGKLFSKEAKNALTMYNKFFRIHQKLIDGQQLTRKEEDTLTKARGFLVGKIIPILERYRPMLSGSPLESYNASMGQLNTIIKEGGDVSQPLENAVKTVAVEWRLQKFTTGYIAGKRYASDSPTDQLLKEIKKLKRGAIAEETKRELSDTEKQLRAIKKEAVSMYKNIGKQTKTGIKTYEDVRVLWNEFERTARRAMMLINEADTQIKISTLTSANRNNIETATSLRFAQIQLEGQIPSLEAAKTNLQNAINTAAQVLSENDPTVKIAKDIQNKEKDPAVLQEAARSLLAIAEVTFLYNNAETFANPGADLRNVKMTIDLAKEAYGWLFEGKIPALKDKTIARRLAYHANHILSPILLEYEKYIYAEGRQNNQDTWRTAFEIAVVQKKKSEGNIDITRKYFADIPLFVDPAFGRIEISERLEIGTEENPNTSPYGITLGQLEYAFANGRIGREKYDEFYNKILNVSMAYGVTGMKNQRDMAKDILNELLTLNEKELRYKLDKLKEEELLRRGIGVEKEAPTTLEKYEKNYNEAKENFEKNKKLVEKMKEGETVIYDKKEISKKEAKELLDRWKGELNAAESYLKIAKEKGLTTIEIPKREKINLDIADWISKNISVYRENLTYPQLIALTEVAFDVIEGGVSKKEVPPSIPKIALFKKPGAKLEEMWPISPTEIAVQAAPIDLTVSKIMVNTWVGYGEITEIAANAPKLFGGEETARSILTAASEAWAVAVNPESSVDQIKNAADKLYKALPESLNIEQKREGEPGYDEYINTINTYNDLRSRLDSIRNSTSQDASRLRADLNSALSLFNNNYLRTSMGGNLLDAIHVFKLDTKNKMFLQIPYKGFVDIHFAVDENTIKAMQENEDVATKVIDAFVKVSGYYLNYWANFREIVPETGEFKEGGMIATGQEITEAGVEVTGGLTQTAFKKATVTYRASLSVTEKALKGGIGPDYDVTESATYLSIDLVDVTLAIPVANYGFKGAGIGLIRPVGGKVAGGEIETPTYGLNPFAHVIFGWSRIGEKVAGGFGVQPGIMAFGQGVEGLSDPSNLVEFLRLYGDILIKLPKDQALGLDLSAMLKGTITKEGLEKTGAEVKGGAVYYIKLTQNITGGLSFETTGDFVNKDWAVVGGIILRFK